MESNRSKGIVILIFLLLTSVTWSKAQTWNEIFRQKQTQKKYLAEQIAALSLYAGYLKKGYTIVNNGLQTVKDISNGEFRLHDAFISSLKLVNPLIRHNSKVSGIILFQLKINKALRGILQYDHLSISNKEYIQTVQNAIISECDRDLDELLLIITSGKVQMTDDERLRRLISVYESMSKKAAFVRRFADEVTLLSHQREQQINQLKNSYEITN